ncbi:MAG: glycosyltransferase family 9 protein [Thiomonas sp.]
MNWRQRLQRWRLRVAYGFGALLYMAFDAVVLAARRPQPGPGRVAVLFPDLLGDVLMWLPYGRALCAHWLRQGQQVAVVCDAASQSLLQAALPDCVIVGLRASALRLSHPGQRAQALRRLRGLGVEQTLYMSHPRGPVSRGEGIVQALGAPAVGFSHCMRDRPAWEVRWSNRRYARLVPSDGRIAVHVQRRFAAFLQALGVTAPVEAVTWPAASPRLVQGDYWVLAPGASQAYRRWPPERFAAVAKALAARHPQWRCVIVGTAGERDLGARIAEALGEKAQNLVGQTTVPELIDLIAHAQLLVGNDSAAGHIAAAVGTPSVVVVGGGHWGLCFPYDAAIAPVRRPPLAVGHRMPCYGCDWVCAYSNRKDQPFPCVQRTTDEGVMEAIDRALSPSNYT